MSEFNDTLILLCLAQVVDLGKCLLSTSNLLSSQPSRPLHPRWTLLCRKWTASFSRTFD